MSNDLYIKPTDRRLKEPYKLGARVAKCRRKAVNGLSAMTPGDRAYYGEAVCEDVRAAQRRALFARTISPLPAPYRCRNNEEIAAKLAAECNAAARARCGSPQNVWGGSQQSKYATLMREKLARDPKVAAARATLEAAESEVNERMRRLAA